MKQYGLIGEKLGHSLSVPIHEAIWEKISLAASYRLIEIPRGVRWTASISPCRTRRT